EVLQVLEEVRELYARRPGGLSRGVHRGLEDDVGLVRVVAVEPEIDRLLDGRVLVVDDGPHGDAIGVDRLARDAGEIDLALLEEASAEVEVEKIHGIDGAAAEEAVVDLAEADGLDLARAGHQRLLDLHDGGCLEAEIGAPALPSVAEPGAGPAP